MSGPCTSHCIHFYRGHLDHPMCRKGHPVMSVADCDDKEIDTDFGKGEGSLKGPLCNSSQDMVNHPPHYNRPEIRCVYCGEMIECRHINRWFIANRAAAFKYIWRAGIKGGPEEEIRDLEKAVNYLQDEIERLKGMKHDSCP